MHALNGQDGAQTAVRRSALHWGISMQPRRVALAIFVLILAALAVLTPQDPFNSQVVTRMGLTLSILEHGEVSIDRFATRTIDKAQWEGHFYADKTPGHSLLALPAAALAKAIVRPDEPEVGLPDDESWRRLVYWTTLGSNGLLSALAAAMLYLTALRLGATREGALFGSVGVGLASPFLGWSTAFFGHSISGSMLFLALALAVRVFAHREDEDRAPLWVGFLMGALLGFVLVVDLTSAPVVALGGLALLVAMWRHRTSHTWPMLLAIVVGGVVGLAPLPIYNTIAFNSPLRLGYGNVAGFEGMREGFFGITVPDPEVIFELLFGLYRGLLPLSPALVLVPFGLWQMLRQFRSRGPALAVLVVGLTYLAVNASYHYWNGGWSIGPRHMMPALPFLGLALAFAWPRSMPGRVGALVLLGIGLVISAMTAATDMFAPENFRLPLTDYTLPHLGDANALGRLGAIILVWIGIGVLAIWSNRPQLGIPAPAPAVTPRIV